MTPEWIVWLAVTVTALIVMDVYEVATRHPERTLTYNLRRILGIAPKKPWRGWTLAGLIGLVGLLFTHLYYH